jgi:hypothetical protein
MFRLDVVVVCRCVSSTDVFLWASSWSCIEACVLLPYRYVTVFLLFMFLVFGRIVVSYM